MRIIRNQSIEQDSWQHDSGAEALAGADLPAPGDLFVSVAHWRARRSELLARPGRLGLRLGVEDAVSDIADDLMHFAAVAVEFPLFNDGRGYTHARELRQRYGYDAEIRAVGDVRRDQLAFMQRCGINAFELSAGTDLEAALAAFDEISVRYQPAADGEQLIFHHRAARRAHSLH